jgi:diguanylate cyclase (GGDEF)-like protein
VTEATCDASVPSWETVLIGDDTATGHESIVSIFDSEYAILEARGVHETMTLLARHSQCIVGVFLDFSLTQVGGFEVLKRMQKNAIWSSIPVVILASDSKQELEALELGAMEYIVKPYDEAVFRTRAKKCMFMREKEIAQQAHLFAKGSAGAQKIQLRAPKQIEDERYRTMYEQTNTILIEANVKTGERFISSNITDQLAGDYTQDKDIVEIFIKAGVVASYDKNRFIEYIYSIKEIAEGDISSTILSLKTISGKREWFKFAGTVLHKEDDDNCRVILTINNVNDEELAKEELRHQAEHDELTDLYNRKKFCAVTNAMLREDPEHSYVLVRWDIERFKIINDLYGMEEGDKLLFYIADKMAKTLDGIGTYARVEADDFVMCYPYSTDTFKTPIRKIMEEFEAYPLQVEILSCFGLYVFEDESVSVDIAIDRANLALASVKKSYLRRYAFYDTDMRETLMREQEIVNEMIPALAQGQFGIYLQPKYSLCNARLIGAEALVRWFHPTKGMISPGEFIPIFERNGFVAELDSYVWRQTCSTLAKWREEGRYLFPVSVNVSRVNLYRQNLIEELLGLVREFDLEPRLLELEITESTYTENPPQLIEVIRELQGYDFKISMDDFGSGYSSLSMLKDIPVDILKVDLNFLEDFTEGGRGSLIMEAIINMAQNLKIPVIAEGVETKQQVDFLRCLACDTAQGYYFARPMPIGDYELLLPSTPS